MGLVRGCAMKQNGISGLNSFRSMNRANEQLRFGIAVLLGKWGWNRPFSWKYRLLLAQDVLVGLKREGFWWQAQILGYWINRFKRGDFTDGIPPLAKDPQNSQPKADALKREESCSS